MNREEEKGHKVREEGEAPYRPRGERRAVISGQGERFVSAMKNFSGRGVPFPTSPISIEGNGWGRQGGLAGATPQGDAGEGRAGSRGSTSPTRFLPPSNLGSTDTRDWQSGSQDLKISRVPI